MLDISKQQKEIEEQGASGYQYFTPDELDYDYQVNDIIGYVPSSYGKTHCDIYIGNGHVHRRKP
jgi:hypothetical protein